MSQAGQRTAGMPLSDFLMQLEDYNPTVSNDLISQLSYRNTIVLIFVELAKRCLINV